MKAFAFLAISLASLAFWSAGATAAGPENLTTDALTIEAKVPLRSEPTRPGSFLAFGLGKVWMLNGKGLSRVDPTDNKPTTIKIPGAFGGFRMPLIGEDGLWIADTGSEFIYKIDPASLAVISKFKARMLTAEGTIALSDGALWVVTAEAGESTLTRFDPATGEAVAKIQLPSDGGGVIAAFGSVWVVGKSKGELYRIDPKTNAVAQTIATHPLPNFLASGFDSIWVFNRGDGVVQRVDGKTGETLATIETGLIGEGGGIATGASYVWVSKGGTPLAQIDPKTNATVRVYKGVGWGGAVVYGADSLWVSGNAIYRIKPPE